MTVLEAFAKAFGPLPEGVDGCFVGISVPYEGTTLDPTVTTPSAAWIYWDRWIKPRSDVEGPNIADRPAESFRGFFGDRYDGVVTDAPPDDDLTQKQ